jgi:hypothetical protein
MTYDVEYEDNIFKFWEIEGGVTPDTPKKQFTITGGTGGTGASLKISYVTTSPVVALKDDQVIIQYKFEGTDSSGEAIPSAQAVWKVNGRVVHTEEIESLSANGQVKINSFELTKYLTIGTQKVLLSVTDDSGNLTTKVWSVQVVDISLESTFDDTVKFNSNTPVTFYYKPYGAIAKTMHFMIAGKEMPNSSIVISEAISGTTQSYVIPG